jgi:signal peptidase II
VKKRHHLMLWPALIIVVLDQITKHAIANSLQVFDSVPVIAGFFNLVHVRNRGMAFGILNRPDSGFASYFLLAASLIAVGLILLWFFKLNEDDSRLTLGLSLILAGAVGNVIDRIRLGEVIDFLDFHWGNYHWPAFNLADAAITVGTISIALSLVFQRKSHT